jgi:hypothetical protein
VEEKDMRGKIYATFVVEKDESLSDIIISEISGKVAEKRCTPITRFSYNKLFHIRNSY